MQILLKTWLTLIHQGKVRDTFSLPDFPDFLLVVATDRISIFDFILPALIKNKGKVLTAMTVFWLTKVFDDGVDCIDHHLIAHGSDIDEYLPAALQGNKELQSRALIVKKLKMLDIECIVRGYLTGSGWKSYQRNSQVCGIELLKGLHDGSKLPKAIFTPTTKAEIGHDEDLDMLGVVKKYGIDVKILPLVIYQLGLDHAEERGVIIADTKFEFGENMVLADEVLTPDSSRFWLMKDWEKAKKKGESPAGYDKQPVREWGKTVKTPFGVTGINNLKPENVEHSKFVQDLIVPEEVLHDCSVRYQEILFILTGQNL